MVACGLAMGLGTFINFKSHLETVLELLHWLNSPIGWYDKSMHFYQTHFEIFRGNPLKVSSPINSRKHGEKYSTSETVWLLAEMISVGTLLAFVLVAGGIIALRYTGPKRTPANPNRDSVYPPEFSRIYWRKSKFSKGSPIFFGIYSIKPDQFRILLASLANEIMYFTRRKPSLDHWMNRFSENWDKLSPPPPGKIDGITTEQGVFRSGRLPFLISHRRFSHCLPRWQCSTPFWDSIVRNIDPASLSIASVASFEIFLSRWAETYCEFRW